jgi:tripartite-type tricarboxylate transporter receptor subunit TctC
MNKFLGTKFRIVTGYTGMADILLAVDRGELGGISVNWFSIASARPGWVPGQTAFAIAQTGLKRIPELPDTPTLVELAQDANQRAVVEFYALDAAYGLALAAPPDIPPDRLAALRDAVEKTLADTQFLAGAKTRGLHVEPSRGTEIAEITRRTLATPPAVIAQVRDLLNLK